MLDLARLAQQMQGISQHLAQEAESAQAKLNRQPRHLHHHLQQRLEL